MHIFDQYIYISWKENLNLEQMITFVFALIKDLLLTPEYPHCVKFLHPATWEHSTITKMSH